MLIIEPKNKRGMGGGKVGMEVKGQSKNINHGANN